MAQSDRRHFPRQNEDAAIQILLSPDPAKGRKGSYDLLSATMRNQSEEGLCIEIDRSLQPGSIVSIKMTKLAEAHSEDAYYMYDGRVIWCKKIDEKTRRYGGGVQLIRKVVRADILTSRF